MNTNNTERGGAIPEPVIIDGWEVFDNGNHKYRFRETATGVEVQIYHWESSGYAGKSGSRWRETGLYDPAVEWCKYIIADRHRQRTAARDRDAALVELVAMWKKHVSDTLEGDTEQEVSRCIAELEALLTNPTPHVEADRQGDVAKQMYAAVKANHEWHLDYDERYDGEPYVGSELCDVNENAVAAYEALHGAEGVTQG